jgi:hypothetical protein
MIQRPRSGILNATLWLLSPTAKAVGDKIFGAKGRLLRNSARDSGFL